MFIESTLSQLYQSAVQAFPHTTMRQHDVGSISLSDLQIVPFVGVNTLFTRAVAHNEDREYSSIILVKNVAYHSNPGVNIIEVSASDGHVYYITKPSVNHTNVLLRCSCPDFSWRFNYYDHVDKSLYGQKRKKYEAHVNPGSANPLKLPGMCKHLMAFYQQMAHNGLLD